MSFRVKGPHTFTVGYKEGFSKPEQVLPGEVLPADTSESDLLNLARNNNLTDDNDGVYNVTVDEETGNEQLVKIVKDKSGNPVEQPVSLNGAVSGQPAAEEVAQTAAEEVAQTAAEEVAQTAAEVDKTSNSGDQVNVVGA